MPVDVRLQQAIASLDDAVEKLMRTFGEMPARVGEDLDWGPREMLVHIVFAHELYVSYMRAILEHKEPPLFRGLYREQNARALAENREPSIPDLLRRLEAAHRQLAQWILDPAVQTAPFYFKAGSKARDLTAALNEIAGHIRGHTSDIRRICRRRSVS
jgi:hypothetical protein